MKILCIFALLLFASCEVEEEQSACRFEMTFSDGLPVQFWLTDCETFNEKEVPGINRACWCQPFNCDDEIVIQFVDDTPTDISLPDLDEWLTASAGANIDWTTGATPSVTLATGENSEYLYTDYAFESGKIYTIEITYTHAGSVNSITTTRLAILDSSMVLQFNNDENEVGPGTYTISISFTADADCTRVGISVGTILAGATYTVTDTFITTNDLSLSIVDSSGSEIESLDFNQTVNGDESTYDLSFSPTEFSPEICNQRISLEIKNGDTVVAKSDCLHIKTAHSGTELIEYSNNRNFAGLIYDADVSPATTFFLRVPAVFFHKRFPQESRAIERTTSTIVTSSKLKKQRLLQVEHVPEYFHEKIIIALSHHNVEIDGKQWKKEEGYEMDEGDPKYPLKKATCYLTEKNFLARNTL